MCIRDSSSSDHWSLTKLLKKTVDITELKKKKMAITIKDDSLGMSKQKDFSLEELNTKLNKKLDIVSRYSFNPGDMKTKWEVLYKEIPGSKVKCLFDNIEDVTVLRIDGEKVITHFKNRWQTSGVYEGLEKEDFDRSKCEEHFKSDRKGKEGIRVYPSKRSFYSSIHTMEEWQKENDGPHLDTTPELIVTDGDRLSMKEIILNKNGTKKIVEKSFDRSEFDGGFEKTTQYFNKDGDLRFGYRETESFGGGSVSELKKLLEKESTLPVEMAVSN